MIKCMDISIRSVEPDDKDKIYNIYKKAIKESEHFSEKREKALMFSKEDMPERIYRGDYSRTVIAEHNGQIIGWGSLMLDEAALDGLFIDPEYQSAGVGTRILDEIENIARIEGLNRIILLTNPGIEDFYIKNGYTKIDESMELGVNNDIEIFCLVLIKNDL